MIRFISLLALVSMMLTNCAKCSKDSNTDESVQQSSAQSVVNNNPESNNTEPPQNQSDKQEGTHIIDPRIRFVQTPDGKVVPEAAFRLKVPKLLNPNILKNVSQQAKQPDGTEDSKKEEK